MFELLLLEFHHGRHFNFTDEMLFASIVTKDGGPDKIKCHLDGFKLLSNLDFI